MRFSTFLIGLFLSIFTITPSTSFAQSGWDTVTAFEGEGIRSTHPITMNYSEWRVKWETEPTSRYGNVFQIYLQKPRQNYPVEVLANVSNQGNASDVTYVYEAGEFYFKVNSANVKWRLIVQVPSN